MNMMTLNSNSSVVLLTTLVFNIMLLCIQMEEIYIGGISAAEIHDILLERRKMHYQCDFYPSNASGNASNSLT